MESRRNMRLEVWCMKSMIIKDRVAAVYQFQGITWYENGRLSWLYICLLQVLKIMQTNRESYLGEHVSPPRLLVRLTPHTRRENGREKERGRSSPPSEKRNGKHGITVNIPKKWTLMQSGCRKEDALQTCLPIFENTIPPGRSQRASRL